MTAHFMRHKCRLGRFVHQQFYPKGSTMVTFPLLPFGRGKPAKRAVLAAALREVRATPARYNEFRALACF